MHTSPLYGHMHKPEHCFYPIIDTTLYEALIHVTMPCYDMMQATMQARVIQHMMQQYLAMSCTHRTASPVSVYPAAVVMSSVHSVQYLQ